MNEINNKDEVNPALIHFRTEEKYTTLSHDTRFCPPCDARKDSRQEGKLRHGSLGLRPPSQQRGG